MKRVYINDLTLKYAGKKEEYNLSFREKIELCKLLDKLQVSVIETEPVIEKRTDSLLVKSICFAVNESIVAVPITFLDDESVDITWNALKVSKKPRLQVPVVCSIVGMEYFYSKKPAVVLQLIEKRIKECKQYCDDVEFIAEDASRSDRDFLKNAINTAINAGATTVTFCDSDGSLLPDEFTDYIKEVRNLIDSNIRFGVSCSNNMFVADANAMNAILAGCDEIKVACFGDETTSIEKITQMIRVRGDKFGIDCSIRVTELQRTINQIRWMCTSNRPSSSPFDSGVRDNQEELELTIHDDINALSSIIKTLGYDLDSEDTDRVYQAFIEIASKKEKVSAKELDAIVASAALQVPATYKLDKYIINTTNIVSSSAHITLLKGENKLEAFGIGDGPIDAAFLAIEKMVGTHYELDDFQIQAVTEGHEAMGETIVRLRANGKVYSGRGISTDIVGSSISAYINAVNKIVYEED